MSTETTANPIDPKEQLEALNRENESLRVALQKIREVKKVHNARSIAFHALEATAATERNQEI